MNKYEKFTEPENLLLIPFKYADEDWYISISKDCCKVYHWDKKWKYWSSDEFASFVPNEDPVGQAKELIFDYLLENNLLPNEE